MCKDCKGITLIKGEDGVGIVNIANNPNGTITVLLSNGTSYTTTSLMGPAGAAGPQGAKKSGAGPNTELICGVKDIVVAVGLKT